MMRLPRAAKERDTAMATTETKRIQISREETEEGMAYSVEGVAGTFLTYRDAKAAARATGHRYEITWFRNSTDRRFH